MNTESWEICCDPDDFIKIRDNEKFKCMVKLSRIVNSLRFSQGAGVNAGGDLSSAADRQRASSFLYMGALLYEALKFTETLGKHFKEYDEYKNGFATMHKDKEINEFRNDKLKVLRNRLVFHLDTDAVDRGLNDLVLDRYIFAQGDGTRNANVYYPLADATLLSCLLGGSQDDRKFIEEYKNMLNDTADLAARFSDSADKLMAEVLEELGFTIKSKE